MANSMFSQNWMQSAGGGYGGGDSYVDPNILHSILLADATNAMNAKRLKKQLEMQEAELGLKKTASALAGRKFEEVEKPMSEAEIKKVNAAIAAQDWNQLNTLLTAGMGSGSERSGVISKLSGGKMTTEPSVTSDEYGTLFGKSAQDLQKQAMMDEITGKGASSGTSRSTTDADILKEIEALEKQKSGIYIPSGWGANMYPYYQSNLRKQSDLESLIASKYGQMNTAKKQPLRFT